MTTGVEIDRPGSQSFPGRIGYRSTVALGFLMAVILLVGGVSLYLASKITQNTDKIKTISGKIEHTDHMHFFMDHLVAEINRAIILGNIEEKDRIGSAIRELQDHIRHYNALDVKAPSLDSQDEHSMVSAIEGDLALLIRLVEKVEEAIAQGTEPSRGDLIRIRRFDDDELPSKFFELNNYHQSAIAEEFQTSRRRMRLITQIYFAFVALGLFGLMGWSWLVAKTIVSPIRHLASATLEVAQGDLARRVPVTSTDEIGQLSHSFNIMAEKLRDHQDKLEEVTALRERERIAQDLHDSLAQDLALIHLQIVEAGRELSAGSTSPVKEILHETQKVAGNAYDNVRQLIFGLRTMVSKRLGLIPTLTEYLHDFSEQKGIAVDLKIDPVGFPEFPAQTEVQLIRIVHEALMNVFKHSRAARSEVRFELDGNCCKVTIEDDGQGFHLENDNGQGFHFGLTTMKERAAAVGGELKIDTAPGKGTRVIVYLPIQEAAYGTYSDSSR